MKKAIQEFYQFLFRKFRVFCLNTLNLLYIALTAIVTFVLSPLVFLALSLIPLSFALLIMFLWLTSHLILPQIIRMIPRLQLLEMLRKK